MITIKQETRVYPNVNTIDLDTLKPISKPGIQLLIGVHEGPKQELLDYVREKVIPYDSAHRISHAYPFNMDLEGLPIEKQFDNNKTDEQGLSMVAYMCYNNSGQASLEGLYYRVK